MVFVILLRLALLIAVNHVFQGVDFASLTGSQSILLVWLQAQLLPHVGRMEDWGPYIVLTV